MGNIWVFHNLTVHYVCQLAANFVCLLFAAKPVVRWCAARFFHASGNCVGEIKQRDGDFPDPLPCECCLFDFS